MAPTVGNFDGSVTFATPISSQAHIKDGKLRALAVLLPARSPLFPTVRESPSSAAPKRDHDEWLVRGRLGEGRVAASQAESIAAWASLLAEPLQRRGRPMQGVPGGKVAMHKAAGHNGRCRG